MPQMCEDAARYQHKFIENLILSESTMSLSVALTTERNQVLRLIVTKFTSRRKVMNVQVF
jgi:hypothetical protein